MKKIFVGLFIGLLLFAPLSVKLSAQTIEPVSVTQSADDLKAELIKLLTEMIKSLQDQLNQMLAVQEQQSVVIQQQQTQLSQISGQVVSQPVVSQPVVVNPIAMVKENSELSVSCEGVASSFDDPEFTINFTANATGGDGNYEYYWNSPSWGRTSDCYVEGPNVSNMTFSDRTGSLSSDCKMIGERTFIGKSQSIPHSSINDSVGNPSLWYWPEKSRFSNKTDVINNLTTVWVKSGNKVVASHCPISVK